MSTHLVAKFKKFKEKISNSGLNYKWISVLVLLSITIGAGADILLKANSVYNLLTQADQHYAQEIADEYYVLISETEDLDYAVGLRNRMVNLSMDVLRYDIIKHGGLDAVDRHPDKGSPTSSLSNEPAPPPVKKPAPPPAKRVDFRSATTLVSMSGSVQQSPGPKPKSKSGKTFGLGFSPDNVFYCRSDHADGVWIVGLDLMRGEGEVVGTMEQLIKIKKKLLEIRQDTGDNAVPLQKSVEELSELIAKENRVHYFDAVKYKKTYNVPLLPK